MKSKEAVNNKEKNPLVTVNILSWNRKDDLHESLIELKKTTYPNIELIVVDNASTDGSPKMVETEFPYVKLIKMPENIGIAGWNTGFKEANGQYIVVLDDDSYPAPDAIELMVEEFEKADKDVGIIAFQVRSAEDDKCLTSDWPNQMITFWGCGAGIKKDLINRIGGYEPKFFLYMNEKEFSIRALKNGFKTIYCKDIIAYHKSSSVHRTNYRSFFYANKNNIFTFLKYYDLSSCFNHIARLLIYTFARALLTYNFHTFFEIWRQALRDFAHDKRDRIKDKDILNFIKDKKWYGLKLGIPPTLTMEIKRVMLKLVN